MSTPTEAERVALVQQIAEMRERFRSSLAGLVIAVISYKGGAGKSTLARELAWVLNANLVDFEYDDGAVSRAMGYRHEQHMTAPLVDALLADRTPRLTRRPGCPLFVPGHPDFAVNTPQPDVLANSLERWAKEWQAPVVVDTHPGGGDATRGAAEAAHLIASPVELAELPLNAAEGMLRGDLNGFPVLLIPNMVRRSPLERHIRRLGHMARMAGANVGPAISRYTWLEDRTLNRPVTAADPMPARSVPYVNEIIAVAEEVAHRAPAAA